MNLSVIIVFSVDFDLLFAMCSLCLVVKIDSNIDLNASNEEGGEEVGEIKINELALSDKERDILYPSAGVNLTTESVFT